MKKIIKNWSYLTVSDAFNQVFQFLVLYKLARELNPDGYGAFNIVYAISMIFWVFANFGMSQIVVREIARNNETSYSLIRKFFIIRLWATVLSVVVLFFYFLFFRSSADSIIIISTIVITISLTAFDFAESIAFGKQIMKYTSFINIGMLFLWAGYLWILPKAYYSIINVLIAYSFLIFLKAFAYYIVLKKLGLLKKNNVPDPHSFKKIIQMCLPYLWLWGIGQLMTQVPLLLLEGNSNDTEVGLFSLGMRLILPLIFTVNTAMKAIFPALSKLSLENDQKFKNSINDGALLIIFFGTLAAFFVALISPYLIPLLFGNAYFASVASFNLLIWFGVVYALDILLGTALSASDRQNTLAILATVDFIVSMPLLYYGSFQGSFGLSVMRFLSGMIVIFYHWIVFRKLLGKSFNAIDWIYLLFFFGSICFLSVETFGINIYLKIIIVLVLTSVYFLYKNTKFYKIPLIIKKQLLG